MTLRTLGMAASIGTCLVGGSLAFAAGDPRAEHEAVEHQLAEERDALVQLKGQKAEAVLALDLVQTLSQGSTVLAKRFGDEVAALELEVKLAEKRELEARVELDATLRRIAPRLGALYRITRHGALALLWDSEDLTALLRRRRALQFLIGADLPLLTRAREQLRGQERALDALDALKRALARRREMLGEELERQQRQRAELTEIVNVLTADAALAARMVGQLGRQSRSLATLVDRLENIPDTGFGALRGFLPPPAPGAFLEAGYGRMMNPRSKTLTFKKGVDLRAPLGTEVRAVAPGAVVYASAYRKYGNLLILDHGDGFHTVMAHLSGFARAVGDTVEEGDVVGRVGDTGSDKGAYLYFELRQNGFAVDPSGWFGRGMR